MVAVPDAADRVALMPSFSEWEARVGPHQRAAEAARKQVLATHARMADVVALRMEDLQGLDEWQTYTRHLDGLIDQAEADVAIAQATILAPETVGDALAVAKGRAAHATGRLDALRLAKALPDQLRRVGIRSPLTVGTVGV
jgi:hypothetical protein